MKMNILIFNYLKVAVPVMISIVLLTSTSSSAVLIQDEPGCLEEESTEPKTTQDKLVGDQYHTIRGESPFVPGEIIVKFTADDVPIAVTESEQGFIQTGVTSIDRLNERYQVTAVENFLKKGKEIGDNPQILPNVFKLVIPTESDIFSAVTEYENDLNVVYVEPNYLYQTCGIPNDPLFDFQWALHNTGQTGGTPDADIDAPEAWNIETGDDDVIIAVIDSGIDYSHPNLAENIWINDDELVDGTDTDGNGYIDDIRGTNFIQSTIDPHGKPSTHGYGLWKDETEVWHFRFGPSDSRRYRGTIGTDVCFQNVTPVNLTIDQYTLTNSTITFDARKPSQKAGFDFELPRNGQVLTFDIILGIRIFMGWIFTPGQLKIGANGTEVVSPFVYIFGNSPFDDGGHGTHCAGIASAIGNDSIGSVGVCWDCTLMPIKAFSSTGQGSLDDIVNAIYYAVDNGADVISMSWGNDEYSEILEDAIEYAASNDVVLVAAAGNEDDWQQIYPAGYPSVIAVAATDSNDVKAGFSNYGDWIDVAAPGVDILSTIPMHFWYEEFEHYSPMSGTSMACPHIAGLAGLLLSKNISITSDMVKTILLNTCEEVESPVYIGRGRLNAYEAVQREPVIALLDPVPYGEDVKGVFDITGNVWRENLDYWVVEHGRGKEPSIWTEITNSTKPVLGDVLTSLDTTTLDEGFYTIRLRLLCGDEAYTDTISVVVNNEYTLIVVDDDGGPGVDHTSIQDAIDDAGFGDTVFVHNGTYFETVVINKAIELIGEDKNSTIIDAIHSDPFYCPGIISIYADGVTIRGFTLQHGYDGVFITSNDNIISENTIINNEYGVFLRSSSNNIITENTISGNGIWLLWSPSNTITRNSFIHNVEAIFLYGSSHNSISVNLIDHGGPPPPGAVNIYGINIQGDPTPWAPRSSKNNTIAGNTITNQVKGVFLHFLTSNNTIYHNNLFNNHQNGKDDDENNWDNGYPNGGNYWGNYDGVDEFHGPDQDIPGPDTIGDTQYSIPGGSNEDRYPLMKPWKSPYIPRSAEALDPHS